MSKTEFVLVETVSSFRHRFVVEVPVGHKIWAEDSVAMNEVYELGQKHLGEIIFSSRVIREDEILELAREDNNFMTEEIAQKVVKRWKPDV